MDGEDAELDNFSSAGRHLSRPGEWLSGADKNLNEWSDTRVIGHTLLSPRKMFVVKTECIENKW